MEIILPDIISTGIFDTGAANENKPLTRIRTTTMYEIELPLENGGISYIDSQAMPISKNLLICAKPCQKRHTKLHFRCFFIHMTLKDGSLSDILDNAPDFITLGNPTPYAEIFRDISKYYDSAVEKDVIMLYSLILKLIYKISEESKKPTLSGKNKHSLIDEALSYIENNLTEKLSLETVAKKVSLSPIYFHNLFKNSTGLTLREYVEEKRIRKAVDMLLSTECTLTEIAYECGFSSQSYFSCAFKRKMKATPREYVNKIYNRYHREK